MQSMSQSSDLIFLDAGIFIGALLKGDPRHPEAYSIVEKARQGQLLTATSVGVLSEVYAALTWIGAQPPQSPEVASQVVSLLVDPPSAIQVLETSLVAGFKMLELAANHRLTARRIHDARHAVTAIVGGISQVYTYDVGDWRIFESDGILIAGPPSVLSR